MNKKFLFEMLNTPSPSGNEFILQKKIERYMSEHIDSNIKDNTGNLINVINGSHPYKVLLCGHVDEISLMITKVLDNGMIKVTANGGINPNLYHGQRVKIIHEGQEIFGIIHVDTNCKEKVDVKVLTIDIGTKSKEETLKYLAVGDYVIHDVEAKELKNNLITCRALDNRVGAFIINEALIRAKELEAKVGVYSASTVGEETSMRGAYWAASEVKPNFSIIVDVTYATDYPGAYECDTDVALGQGGVLCLSSIVHPKLNKLFKDVAEKLNYNIQYEAAPRRTGTDGDQVIKSAGGTPIVLISIPLRNMHSPVEIVSLKDVEEIIEIIANVIKEIDDGFDLSLF